MGCANSNSTNFDEYCKSAEYLEWKGRLRFAQLQNNDLINVYNAFLRMDKDLTGRIDCAELIGHLNVERTIFTGKVFSLFDAKKSGNISFVEFIVVLWNYCTLSKNSLVTFVFNMYDTDGSGVLTSNQVIEMLKELFVGKITHTLISKIVLDDLLAIERTDAHIDIARFREFLRFHQTLLSSVFQLQTTLRTKFLGVKCWELAAHKRTKHWNDTRHIALMNLITKAVRRQTLAAEVLASVSEADDNLTSHFLLDGPVTGKVRRGSSLGSSEAMLFDFKPDASVTC